MLNRTWNVALILLAVAFIGLLAAFGAAVHHTRELAGRLETAQEPGAEGRIRVALISQELDNPFWRSVEDGARAYAARYNMDLTYMGPLRINPEEQTRLLEKAIAEGFRALLVQGLNDARYATLIREASENGIPVIAIDADEPNSPRIAYIGTDNRKAGEEMAAVIRTAGTTGRIGVLIGSETNNQQLRLEGFRSVVGQVPGLSIADVRVSEISRLQATEQAEAMLRAYPDLLAAVGFSALDGVGIAEAAKRAGASGLRVFAFDDLANTRQAIRERRIAAALVQQPGRMGQEAVVLLNDFLEGRAFDSLHYTATTVLDRRALDADSGGQTAGTAP